MKKLWIFIAMLSFITVISNCRHGYNNETKISNYGNDESHNMGSNCMNCHRLGGEGEGWFVVAGTVYDSLTGNTSANGTVRLYSEPLGSGQLRVTLQVDAKGNFYTTQKIDFGAGLYPAVTSQNGNTNYMGSAIGIGACNSCHGVSTAHIQVYR